MTYIHIPDLSTNSRETPDMLHTMDQVLTLFNEERLKGLFLDVALVQEQTECLNGQYRYGTVKVVKAVYEDCRFTCTVKYGRKNYTLKEVINGCCTGMSLAIATF